MSKKARMNGPFKVVAVCFRGNPGEKDEWVSNYESVRPHQSMRNKAMDLVASMRLLMETYSLAT